VKSAGKFHVVLVTAPDLKTARRLAGAALKARLVACANIIPRVESHYWWQGKIETSAEVLILFKTTRTNLAALETVVLAKHPYDTPEIVSVSLARGTKKYLGWIGDSLKGGAC